MRKDSDNIRSGDVVIRHLLEGMLGTSGVNTVLEEALKDRGEGGLVPVDIC